MERKDYMQSKQPAPFFCVYEQADAQYYSELKKYLYPWERQQKIFWLELKPNDLVKEIQTKHLRDAELILLLLSPDFFQSQSCYDAMLAALVEREQRHIPVKPLLARMSAWQDTECRDLEPLPDEQYPITHRHWSQREEAYEQIRQGLLRLQPDLEQRVSQPVLAFPKPTPAQGHQGVPTFQVPELAADYVPRPDVFEAIKRSLLQPGSAQTTAITTALQGAGGFGKTTLAIALGNDPDVRVAFPDGVFWIVLGEQHQPADLLTRLNQLLRSLGDTGPETSTLEEALAHWRQALAHKTCLLIIDDVWQASALTPLLEGGPTCRRLVTTRNDGVLPQNAQRVVVDAMSEQEAIAVLTRGLPIELSQFSVHAASLAELVAHLGHWPLLLSVAQGQLAAQVRHGRSLTDALEIIRQSYQGQRGVSILAHEARGFQETVDLSLQASFRQLQEVIAVRYRPVERYEELAVFPEDTDIPIDVLRLFWQATGGLAPWETDELCMQLASLSLVSNCDLEAGTIRLHDVTRSYLVTRAGERLPQLQGQLLDAVKQGLSIQRWAEVPRENTYLWQHLIWHLCQAARWEEVHTAVTDVRFLTGKIEVSGVTRLEADLQLLCQQPAPSEHLAIWQMLQRRIGQSSHLLRQVQTRSELGGLLLAHLGWESAFFAQRLQGNQFFTPPFLTAWHPLPDDADTAFIRTLAGHRGSVFACVFSPDGRQLLSASHDGTLKLWETSSGRELRILASHRGPIFACAFSPDGRQLLSASHDGTLKLWETSSGQELRTLTGHRGPIFACAFSPDGCQLLSASHDGTLKLWDASSGQELRTLASHRGSVNACAFSPDGHQLLSASDDGMLKLWETSSGQELRTLTGHTYAVNACAFSPDGCQLLSASDDGTLKLWETSSGWELRTLTGHTYAVNACAFSPDGRQLLSASDDGTLKLWDASSGQELHTLASHRGSVNACTFSPDGLQLLSASDDGTLKLWDTNSGRERRTLTGHRGSVNACAFSPDGRQLLSASNDDTLKLWDTSSGRELRTLTGHRGSVNACAFSPDGRQVLSVSYDRTLKLWEVASGRYLLTFPVDGTLNCCTFHLDGKYIAAGGDAGLYLLQGAW
jgi:WD40 repeat protein